MRREPWIFAPILDTQLVGRVPRNGFGAVGNYNLLVEGSVNGRVGLGTGVCLLLVNPFAAFECLTEGDSARGLPADVEHDVVACALTGLQSDSAGAVN